jgi:hypothetical protein
MVAVIFVDGSTVGVEFLAEEANSLWRGFLVGIQCWERVVGELELGGLAVIVDGWN